LIGISLKEGKAWGDFIGYNNVIPPELILQTIETEMFLNWKLQMNNEIKV
jgi:hypothetical protein